MNHEEVGSTPGVQEKEGSEVHPLGCRGTGSESNLFYFLCDTLFTLQVAASGPGD